jgi:uncharacterized protein YjbJ (UPF0337 family)
VQLHLGAGGEHPPLQGEEEMNSSTKDKVEGKFHELKGKAKQKAGQVVGNPKVESEGQSEKVAGKVQKKVGQIESVLEK